MASTETVPTQMSVERYYADTDVQRRMLEYCGGTTPTAVYVAGYEPGGPVPGWNPASRGPALDLPSLWNQNCDIARSLWDTDHLIFFLELDYLNIDRADEPFTHPAEVFFKLEPAYRAASRFFRTLGMHPAVLVTGRGYHFVGQIPLTHPLIDALATVVPVTPTWYAGYSARRPHGVTAVMSARQARAAAGLGCLLEYSAHQILYETPCELMPVVFNGTVVGRGLVGRECVSIDFSHAGDPLDTRHVRIAFSSYQAHRLRPDIFGWQAASAIPPLAAIPRGKQSFATLLTRGRSLKDGIAAARGANGFLPDVTDGVDRLLRHYESSALAAFHRSFYKDRGEDGRFPKLDPADLPPCVSAPLLKPNDLLLKPEHLQHLVRSLLAHGWSAPQISALIQSKYESDHNWGDRWQVQMDARTRGEFEARVFAGMVATGADSLVDFNCVSAQEKNICPFLGCPHDLRVDRDQLVSTRTYLNESAP